MKHRIPLVLTTCIFFFIGGLSGNVNLSAQSDDDSGDHEPSIVSGDEEQKTEPETESGQGQTLSTTESRRETLLYGINTEIIEVLDALKTEENSKLNETVFEVFRRTQNIEVRTHIIQLYTQTKDGRLIDTIIEALMSEDPIEDGYTVESFRYLDAVALSGEHTMSETLETIYSTYMSSDNRSVAGYAIRGLGKAGGEEGVARLMALLESNTISENLKDDVILAIGDAKAGEAVEILAGIVRNTTADSSTRWYACDSLGKIGTPECLQAIKGVLNDDDTVLRTYAVSALGYFPGSPDIVDLLVESLRDSYWKVRVSAANSLISLSETVDVSPAIDILSYKARKDPEQKVRSEAVRTLAKIGNGETKKVLFEILSSEKEALALRITALEALAESGFGGLLPEILETIRREWDQDLSKGYYATVSKFVEQSCKVLSEVKHPDLKDFFMSCLSHPKSIPIQIYGLRGIARNGIIEARDVVEEMTGTKYSNSVRREAHETLDVINGITSLE